MNVPTMGMGPLQAMRQHVLRFLLLALLPLACRAATLPPEREYTLQTRVLLQDDDEARQELQRSGEGLAPEQAMDWQPTIDDVPAWLGRQKFPAPSPAVTAAFADALGARLRKVRCAAQGFVPLGSPEIGLYALLCHYPDIEPLRPAYLALQAANDAGRKARSDALFSAWTLLLRDAPDIAHCTPVTGWYRAHDEFTHAERAHQLHQTVLAGLLPLDRWDAGTDIPDAGRLCDGE